MIIVIPLEEIEEKFRPYFKFGTVRSLSIDYSTNAIHGYIGEEEHIIFRFKDWGIYLDNRRNSHLVSGGESGILVRVC